jgi:uncharacterized membrane protein
MPFAQDKENSRKEKCFVERRGENQSAALPGILQAREI